MSLAAEGVACRTCSETALAENVMSDPNSNSEEHGGADNIADVWANSVCANWLTAMESQSKKLREHTHDVVHLNLCQISMSALCL